MRVLVIHHSLNSCGGGERVALHLIRLCQLLDHEVAVATCESTDWEHVRRVLGVELLQTPREYSLLPFRLRTFGIYQRALMSMHMLKLRNRFDLAINTHGDVLIIPTDIVYVHFPVTAYAKMGILRPYIKYYRSMFWRLYFEPYRHYQEHLIDKFRNSILITNSSFSRHFIRKVIGKDAMIIYPPVEVDQYLRLAESDDREEAVIYIARYSPEKNNHLLIHVARELPNIKFYLVGSAHGKGLDYYRYCLKLRDRLGVKNVEVLANVPHEDKLRLLSRCRVYVHLFLTEHFGISVVEALAAGLVPVVPVWSGTWTDVCERGRYGIGYTSLDVKHLAEKILEALDMWRRGWLVNVREHVQKFSVDAFYARMGKILEIWEEQHDKR